jgi:ParB family chromosome partitioning protein
VIEVGRIGPDPSQPRTEFDAESLGRLAESLKTRGQLQPIRVRWDAVAGRYVIVLGERRWRGAQLAGLASVACVVIAGNPSADELLEDQLVENALREDLKPVEQARAFRSLMDRTGMSQNQLASKLGIGQGTISKAIALLGLPTDVQIAVDAGDIAPRAAREMRARPGEPKRSSSRPRPWSHKTDRVEVIVRPRADDVTDEEITEALRAAVGARRKMKGRADAA